MSYSVFFGTACPPSKQRNTVSDWPTEDFSVGFTPCLSGHCPKSPRPALLLPKTGSRTTVALSPLLLFPAQAAVSLLNSAFTVFSTGSWQRARQDHLEIDAAVTTPSQRVNEAQLSHGKPARIAK